MIGRVWQAMRHTAALLAISLLLIATAGGCSSDNADDVGLPDTSATPDSNAVTADSGPTPSEDAASPDAAPADASAPADAPPSCGPGIYPCGPYGTNEGDVIANLTFKGWGDPDFLCKPHEEQSLDLGKPLRSYAFKDWHQGYVNGCTQGSKKELLWVTVGAGWCKPCKEEHVKLQKAIAAGKFDQRVGLLSIVIEDDSSAKVDKAFLKIWAKNPQFTLTFPAVMDPTYKSTKFFDAAAIPFNMLVRLDTMEMLVGGTGLDIDDFQQRIDGYFQP